MSADGYISNSLGSYGVPQELDCVRIEFGKYQIYGIFVKCMLTILLKVYNLDYLNGKIYSAV